MSQEQNETWRPSASLDTLKKRAQLIQHIRAFFYKRNVMEVETPLLCQHTVTDPHIESFQSEFNFSPLSQTYFLQTSPEYAMKRLVSAGSGAIFQICKAFRNGEVGSQHNPEFSILEWYRPGFTHHDLMQEVDALFQHVLHTQPADQCRYRDLFLTHLQFDPFTIEKNALQQQVQTHCPGIDTHSLSHDDALTILLTHCIEPHLGRDKPIFIYDYPASQCALATLRHEKTHDVAQRFELYYKGKECANGFHELTNAAEQQQRFEKNQQQRQANNQFIPAIDSRFIDALQAGLPACAGVAVGIDRLMMLALSTNDINDVISFDFSRA